MDYFIVIPIVVAILFGIIYVIIQKHKDKKAGIDRTTIKVKSQAAGKKQPTVRTFDKLLIQADLGPELTVEIVEKLGKTQSKEKLAQILVDEIEKSVDAELTSTDSAENETENPNVILFVGVNGVGKTTTIGKIAHQYSQEGKTVILAAADTFRAAAADQLTVWGERSNAQTVKSDKEGADPSSVAFEAAKKAVEAAKTSETVLLVDTAGRLQNKQNLMDELSKIVRTIEKQAPISETIIVIDATTGQNAINQVKEFSKIANITGIALTKLDGSAKGGVVISVSRQTGIPVKFVGVGEGIDDIKAFDAHSFVEELLA